MHADDDRSGARERRYDDRGTDRRDNDDRQGGSGARRHPAGGRDGDRRRPYDRSGGAPRRDGRPQAGTSRDRESNGARTGDVREGGWSDTWSDRRRRDARSDASDSGSRADRPQTTPAPPLSDDIAASALDPAARRDLGGLQKDVAEAVARHLVAAGMLVDEDPAAALAHARYARRRASRIAVVREAAGIAAYHAGEWAEALAELRAARRMGGGPGHLAVMADIERAMGRPERAIELSRGPEARELGRSEQIELAIVVAGARRDLGEIDAAVVALQLPELDASRRDPWSARLFYAYADNLLAAGRESDALQWFVHAADADADGQTDADARIADLTGEPLADDGIEFAMDEEDTPDGADDGDQPSDPAVDGAAPTPSTGQEAAAVSGLAADEVGGSAVDEKAAPVSGAVDAAEVAAKEVDVVLHAADEVGDPAGAAVSGAGATEIPPDVTADAPGGAPTGHAGGDELREADDTADHASSAAGEEPEPLAAGSDSAGDPAVDEAHPVTPANGSEKAAEPGPETPAYGSAHHADPAHSGAEAR